MMDDLDSVKIELEAERHVHRKDNEYLTSELARVRAERDALLKVVREEVLKQRELSREIDDGADFGEHVGIVRWRRNIYDGRAEVLGALIRALPAHLREEIRGLSG